MRSFLFIAACCSLLGCIEKSTLKPIVPYHVLHANSSKVWILESRQVDGEEQAPELRERKRVFTFFDDMEVFEQEMVHLGSNYGLLASYSMQIDQQGKDTGLNVYYQSNTRKRYFRVTEIGYKELRLEVIPSDSIKEEWLLIPLNKPS